MQSPSHVIPSRSEESAFGMTFCQLFVDGLKANPSLARDDAESGDGSALYSSTDFRLTTLVSDPGFHALPDPAMDNPRRFF
jgi:hypothetical protein